MTKHSETLFKSAVIESAKSAHEKIMNAEKLQSELRQQRREARKKAEADEQIRIESQRKDMLEKGFQIDASTIESIVDQVAQNFRMHLFENPIQKTISDYELATAILLELFTEFRENNFYFNWIVEMCKKRINNDISDKLAESPKLNLLKKDFKMILNILVENGYIRCQKTRNKPPNDIVYKYNKAKKY